MEGLAPEAVSLLDMSGNLLSKPRRTSAADGSEITSESLEVRQQIERTLLAKVNATLEPLLGANGFRAGASVDCDLTSGEQQEETLDPAKSVMTSSQKTEEATDRPSMGGVPGTASNLPASGAAASMKGSGGVSRRTENITYQTSRVVRHTRIPQGVIRRMSLAVLVDQAVKWEGEGAARQKVLVPPAPETLKTIRDLVAGVTGFNEERGDQLIVETLPFESKLNAQPPPVPGKTAPGKQAPKGPAWLEFLKQYRDMMLPASLGLAVLLVVALGIFRVRKSKRGRASVELPEQFGLPPAGAYGPVSLPGGESAGQLDELPGHRLESPALSESDRDQLADRVRQLAKRDPAATANVLRMWLQEKPEASNRT